MITGGKIENVEVKREKDAAPTGLGINVNIDEVKVEKGLLHIRYTFTADYAESVATLKMSGILLAEESKPEKIAEEFKKSKKLPDTFAEEVLSTITFVCGTTGTIIAKAMNLMPPMVPSRLTVEKASEPAGKSGKKAA